MSEKLDSIKLRHSPMTDSIYLCRFGKNPNVALDKRDAERDVMAVLVQHMMHNSPTGAIKVFTLGGQAYRLKLTPVDANVPEDEK